MMKYLKGLLAITLFFSVLSAAVPLHNIFHKHYFVTNDTCGNSCDKHLKNYTKPCCSTSDAIFISDLSLKPTHLAIHQPVIQLDFFFSDSNYFQFFHLTKNKAPPVVA